MSKIKELEEKYNKLVKDEEWAWKEQQNAEAAFLAAQVRREEVRDAMDAAELELAAARAEEGGEL